jgi:hypothetical protein
LHFCSLKLGNITKRGDLDSSYCKWYSKAKQNILSAIYLVSEYCITTKIKQVPAVYNKHTVESIVGKKVPLDHNHTHFILVDDGTESKFGGEIEFRSKLEGYISRLCIRSHLLSELAASLLAAIATRSDTGSHNRLDLIQSLVPTHCVCNGYIILTVIFITNVQK